MKTSHGTPRARAASASAWAWLPALPATTPRAHASPSAASLFSAPRILNEPVRCRYSALSSDASPPGALAERRRRQHRRAARDVADRAARRALDVLGGGRARQPSRPGSATTASISTCAPFGSAATPIADARRRIGRRRTRRRPR